MTTTEIDEFLKRRQDDYEELMLQYWDQAQTIDELTGYHRQIKTEITLQLKEKWKKEMGGAEIPNEIRDLLPKKIDEVLKVLETHFERSSSELKIQRIESVKYRKQNPSSSNESQSTKSSSSRKTEYAIGIDLGTTMCCVAVLVNGEVKIVENRSYDSSKLTPSYVAFRDDGTDSFGVVAKEEAHKYSETTIYDAKRMIGRNWNDPILQNDRKLWPFEIVEENGNPKIKTGSRTRYPHEISARLLSRFRAMAEEFLYLHHGTIKKAVITVPAYFSEPQRRATRDAAMCAGLEVLNILSEPTAAAIAYNWERRLSGTRKVLIYDLGGGTFDVSIAIVEDFNVEILCVHGDTHLGGQDFDQLLVEYCIEKFEKETGINLTAGKSSQDKRTRDIANRALGRLRIQCETVKKRLSGTNTASVEVASIMDNTDLSITITRDTLNTLCTPLIEKTLDIVDLAIKDAIPKGLKGKEDIDDVILVGGSTRMLLVEEMLEKHFGGKMLCKSINPDEAVAYGAAVDAGILSRPNNRKSQRILQIQDVTPLTLGIECVGDAFSPIIPRNTKIPCEYQHTYCTAQDNQKTIRLSVFQGENGKASENIKLGEFIFSGIPAAPAEQEKIKVMMSINSMGILQVRAISESGEKESVITITSTQLGMNDDEMDALSKELENLIPQ